MHQRKGMSAEAVERLRRLIYSTQEFRAHLPASEPDYDAVAKRARLPAAARQDLADCLRGVRLLVFVDFEAVAELLVFKFAELPALKERLAAAQESAGLRLVALFEYLLEMAMQGNSLFPQSPARLAAVAREALKSGRFDEARLAPLAELLLDPQTGAPRAGANAAMAADLDVVILSEHQRREGMTEWAWKSEQKYQDYRQEVLDHPEFQADWAALGRRFNLVRQRDSHGIIRRSPIPEGNWQRLTHPPPPAAGEPFQVAFDFFCWKWFLYGMRGDEPLPEKLFVTLTPSGTQLFIPGYWNLDPHRDIRWKAVTRLHRARGLAKQGPKLAANRRQRHDQLRRLLIAEGEAKQRGLRGEHRSSFLKQQAGLAAETDDRQVRRLIAEAKIRRVIH